jgi:hypothetical protein
MKYYGKATLNLGILGISIIVLLVIRNRYDSFVNFIDKPSTRIGGMGMFYKNVPQNLYQQPYHFQKQIYSSPRNPYENAPWSQCTKNPNTEKYNCNALSNCVKDDNDVYHCIPRKNNKTVFNLPPY